MSTPAPVLPDVAFLEVSDAKDALRVTLREQRRHRHRHPVGHHDPTCEALTEHALQAVAGMGAVAAYVSVGYEPCTRLLLEELRSQGVRVLLPVLGPRLSRSWRYFAGSDDLAERAPGRPPEPSGQPLPPEEIGQVEAVLVPALAVDLAGRRLGQGGGWYDRVLPLRRPQAPVFALVYGDELVTRPLPAEPHDVPVDAVITPTEWFLLQGSAFSGR